MSAANGVLRRLGVQDAEQRLFALAGVCLFLLSAAAFAALNTAEALFLKRVGVAYLPWVLLASSGLLVVTTAGASRLLAGRERPRWLPVGLFALALLPAFFVAFAGSEAQPVFWALVLGARQILAVGLLMFWLALGDLVTGRQAKRLFAPLAAGITLGGIVGSFACDPVSRAIGIGGLLAFCSALLAGAALVSVTLRSAAPARVGRGGGSARERGRPGVSFTSLLRDSRLFRLLAVALLCGGVLGPVLYFEFSAAADAATTGPGGEQALIALLSQFRGWLNVAMLFAQLWLSGWLYRNVGLPLTLAVWPTTFVLGFSWLAVAPSLPAGVISLGATRIAEDGIAGSALRVLFNLFPERERAHVAGVLEGPVTRIGGVLGNGLVLTLLAGGGATWIGLASLPVALAWLAGSIALWRAYPTLLLQASAEHSLSGLGADKEKLLDARTLRALAPELADPDPNVARAALDLVVDAGGPVTAGLLAEALEEAPAETRALLVDRLNRLVEPLPAGTLECPTAVDALARILTGAVDLPADQRADLLQVYARLTAAAPGREAQDTAGVLDRALGDREAAVRLVAIAELQRRGQPPPGVADLDTALREALAGRDAQMRRAARKELRAMLLSTSPNPLWERRLALLGEQLSQRVERAGTAEALAAVARQHNGATVGCAEAMVARAEDRDPRVRAAVLSYLGHAGLDAEACRLVVALGARADTEALAAREGLVALGDAGARALLDEPEFESSAQRQGALYVLRELEVDETQLRALYARQLEAVRGMLVLRGAPGLATASPLLARRLEERIREGQGALLSCVGVLRAEPRLAELEHRFRRTRGERERDILVEAIEALLSGDERAQLIPFLESGTTADRGRRAARALGRRVPDLAAAVSELMAADHDPLTRRLAEALVARGLEAPGASGDASGVLDPMNVAVRLQSVVVFDRLSTQQLVALAEALVEENFEADATVFRVGEEGSCLYLVLEGAVDLSEGLFSASRIEPGAFFGELSALDGVPRSATAVAVGQTRLLRLDREPLLALMEEAPALGVGLSQYLSLRVRSLEAELAARPAPE